MEKTQLIDTIIVQVDAMLEMRGVEKCRCAVDTIGKLAELKKIIQEEDAEHQHQMDTLREELRRITKPDGDGDTETIDGKTYQIGVAGGH